VGFSTPETGLARDRPARRLRRAAPTLTKCDVLQPTVEQIAEDCGTLNRYASTADAVAGFGK